MFRVSFISTDRMFFIQSTYFRRTLLNQNYSCFMNRIAFDSISWKHTNLHPIGKPRINTIEFKKNNEKRQM